MTDKQSEALKIANYLDSIDETIAAETLRRLHEVNAELVRFAAFVLRGLDSGAIKAKPILDFANEDANEVPIISLASMARAALTKAEGK